MNVPDAILHLLTDGALSTEQTEVARVRSDVKSDPTSLVCEDESRPAKRFRLVGKTTPHKTTRDLSEFEPEKKKRGGARRNGMLK